MDGEPDEPARTGAAISMSATACIPQSEQRRLSSVSNDKNGKSQVSSDFPMGLTSQDLRAPVSAVHQMSTPEERKANATGPASMSQSTESPQQPSETFGFLGRMEAGPDIVTKGLIQQSQARNLFNL